MYKLVKNDTGPRLNFTLTQNSAAINLTGATVRFKFRKQGAASTLFSRPCTIVSAVAGTCYYDWQSGDLASTGVHLGEVEITFPGGSVQTSKDFLKFEVRDEL
jgi:hypothetical protein